MAVDSSGSDHGAHRIFSTFAASIDLFMQKNFQPIQLGCHEENRLLPAQR